MRRAVLWSCWVLLVGCAGDGALEPPTGDTVEPTDVEATNGTGSDTMAPADLSAPEDEGAEPELPEPADLPPIVPNAPPVLTDDEATAAVGGEPIPLKVLYNDADPDGHMLRVTEVTTPTWGQVEIVYGGTQLRYTPPAEGAFGADSFQYTASDDHGGLATATVTVALQVAPTLQLTSPQPGAVLDGPMLTVTFEATGCQFTTPSKNSAGCHAHKFLDAAKWFDANGQGFGHYVNSAISIGPLAPGEHTFTLLLIKNDGWIGTTSAWLGGIEGLQWRATSRFRRSQLEGACERRYEPGPRWANWGSRPARRAAVR